VYDKIQGINNGSINNIIGYMYAKGHLGSINYTKSHIYFKLSAEQGNSYGQYNIGKNYIRRDRLVPTNIEKGLEYIELSASQNNPYANWMLAILCKDNYEKYQYYLKLAADCGLKRA
jgi:TPR repeat protein